MSARVTPWWRALQIRRDILDASGQLDDVRMSLFDAVHGIGAAQPRYADASYYGEITHPTERLVDLLTEIAIRIGAGPGPMKARAVTRLDQGMGGGKSHACIGAFHLASNPEALLSTELGAAIAARAKAKLGRALSQDLDRPLAVVLPCDSMTPGAPVADLDGPATNLYERFLWRLFSKDYSLYERYQPFWSDKSKIAEALRAVNRPVLVIIDEVLDYIGNGLDGALQPGLVAQDMGFLRALLDVANEIPAVAVLAVMIASDSDKTALSEAGQARRDDLSTLLERDGTPATVTEAGDFASILRRRLFDAEPASEVISATADLYRPVLDDKAWTKNVWDPINATWRARWDEEVASCYPFHPMLISLAREEWSKLTGFQRVRSTIRIFAATVYAQQQRGKAGEWVPALVGPGDLPLGESAVREALLGSGLVEDERTIANYRSLAEVEVVNQGGTSGTARLQDLGRPYALWTDANPRAAERAASFVLLASVVGTLRPGRGKGASAPEVKAATCVPDPSFTVTDADSVVEDLVHAERGMSAVEVIPGQGNNKPARYFLSTRLTHRMLVNNIRRTILDSERDEIIASFAERLASSGPFRDLRFIKGDKTRDAADVLATAGLDTAHTNRLFVLDPAQFSFRNGMEEETVAALSLAMGLAKTTRQLPVQWASSAVYAVMNTRQRALARGLATEYLARERALKAPEVQNDAELRATGITDLASAKEQLEKAVKRAYQHVAFLAQPDPAGERRIDQVSFEDEHTTALDGTFVWKALAERDKVFDAGEFSAKALIHNLRESDYGKTLSDLRAAFYSAPRLPLLYDGERDLQQAIYDAVTTSLVEVVDALGTIVAVTAPAEINLASTGLRLRKPLSNARHHAIDPGLEPHEDSFEDGTFGSTAAAQALRDGSARSAVGDPSDEGVESPEQQLAFSFTRNLLANQADGDMFAALFRALYLALDEGRISYLQGTIQVLLDPTASTDLQDRLGDLGISVSIKDV